MKKTIVTALYNHSPHSRIGGRGYSLEHYRSPFKNLLSLDCNLVVFTHESVKSQLEIFLKENNFFDFVLIDFDLENFRFTDEIFRMKENIGLIDKDGLVPNRSYVDNDRNYHLCLLKPFFLKKTIEDNLFESDEYFWVDAGLFHHGLIPDSLGGMERLTSIKPNLYWPYNSDNICNPNLIELLKTKINYKGLLFLGIDGYYSQPIWWSKISNSPKITHIIGGFFGGNKHLVIEMVEFFEEKLSLCIDTEILTLEEEVLSIVYSEKYSSIEYHKFKTWYHDIPTERNYFGIEPGSESFYKIFLK